MLTALLLTTRPVVDNNSPIQREKMRVSVSFSEDSIADDVGGDDGEVGAVGAVTEGVEDTGGALRGTDIGQAVPGFAEGAGPGVGGLALNARKEFAKSFVEDTGFRFDQTIAFVGINEVFVCSADHEAIVGGGAQVAVGAGGFPEEELVDC